FWPARTPGIHSNSDNSIATINYIEIGGVEQCVLIRGEDTDNPILLFLHGGPGMPMMYMAHEFQRPLEKHFTVVQWDRRGAGKTYSRNIPSAESMNVNQILKDAFTLIDTLKTRYNQEKIILAGHSFGTYLGSIMVSQRPELFSAYVSIGQVVDNARSLTLQEAFIREQAEKSGRDDIISALEQPSKPGFENWLFEFGGELKESKSFFPLIWSGLQAPEYTLAETLDVAKGSSFSSLNMKYNVLTNSILEEITAYNIPVYFFIGQSDYTTPHELVQKYYETITAPDKEIVYFENSAHFPFFEEPEKFCKEILRLLGAKN
ncbi:MAG: alpha/beta hydrolase, partial [Bacteroidetes bacterium]